MKEETKKKWKEVGKICYGLIVGGFAALGVISLVGMVKSCSKGEEITPVVTTPVVTTTPKKLPADNINIDHTSPFGQANKWAEFQLSTSYRGIGDGSENDLGNISCFAVRFQGKYSQIDNISIYQEVNDSNTSNLVYWINDDEIKICEVELDNQDHSVNSATWYCDGFYTLPQYIGNYPSMDKALLDSLTANGLLASSTPIGEFENPVFPPSTSYVVNYGYTGGYWVDNLTGGVVTTMIANQSYDLVWVSVQGYLYPTDTEAEAHTSIDGGVAVFSTKEGRVHMDFLASSPALSDKINIVTNLSSLAIPGGTSTGNDQVNTTTGLSNSFALLGSAFASMAGLLSMEVFPGLSLSALLFVPVVVAVILFIIKAIGK